MLQVFTRCKRTGFWETQHSFHWTPSWAQQFLFVATIVTSLYAWNQKDYFED
jgi:hypothetical protein